jgi:tetratricopeptide (TPR) repeat protein
MNLIEMTEKPEELIKLYSKLENKFPSKMRTGINYYNLAKTYEKAGEFGNAIKTYRKMINLRDKNIPGGAEKYEYIKEMLVYSSREEKGWLYSNKEKLINNLKYGIRTKNGSVLQRTASRQDFFVVSWAAEEQAVRQGFINNFQRFLQGTWQGPVKYDRDLDNSSNDTEAYLKTYNWSWRIRTWYFYFRKLDFPADPEINGKWEWKGIYVGDKPFSSNESL